MAGSNSIEEVFVCREQLEGEVPGLALKATVAAMISTIT